MNRYKQLHSLPVLGEQNDEMEILLKGKQRERQTIDCCILSFLEGAANHLVW
jgi:hypothetical protein